MNHYSTRVLDTPFTETGTFVYEGREFTEGGAFERDGILFCYHRKAPALGALSTVGNWDGSVTFGSVIRSRGYTQGGFGGFGIRMRSLLVRRPDGSLWHGRYGYDWRDCVRLRPCKRSGRRAKHHRGAERESRMRP
jgi:hypothetical protein